MKGGVLWRPLGRGVNGALGLVVLGLALVPLPAPGQARPACTEVLGFSQSMQWYAALSLADGLEGGGTWELGADEFLPGWQGRFTFGASIDRWTDPDFDGWEGTYVTPLHCDREEVDRVVLNVSGAARPADEWAAAIDSAGERVRARYPGVREVVAQPVVGAPPGECRDVRAARNQPAIVRGIALAAERGGVTAGPDPTVSSCGQFLDTMGHLTEAGARYIHEILLAYYSSRQSVSSTSR